MQLINIVITDIKNHPIEWLGAVFIISFMGYIFGVTPSLVWFYGFLLMLLSLYGYIEQGWKNIWKENYSHHLKDKDTSYKSFKSFIGEFSVILFHKAPLVIGVFIFCIGLLIQAISYFKI